MLFSRGIKKAFRKCGIEVGRFDAGRSVGTRMLKQLSSHGIDLIFDVGANEGQYARSLRELGYAGNIISFEPLSTAHEKLTRTAQNDPRWVIAPRVAVGAFDGLGDINVAGNSTSSSLLDMLETHWRAAPGSQYVGHEHTAVCRLDSFQHPTVSTARALFVKIDTQGSELSVLSGAVSTLARAKGLQLELSLVPLYKGQALYVELAQRVLGLGFELWDVVPGFVDGDNGRLLQFDGVFFKP